MNTIIKNSSTGAERRPRIALVSTGLGRVLRGFESFTDSLHEALCRYVPQLDVTLFQGGASSRANTVVVPNFHREDLPARLFSPLQASLIEYRSFALALYPILRVGKYDVVHYNELPMGSALFHLRRWFGGNFSLLYCNGAPSPPIHYKHRCDKVQLLTVPDYDLAISEGVDREKIFQLPYGLDEKEFHPKKKHFRAEVRRELGVPGDVRLVLSLAAIKSEHKRIDYLIEEVSRLDSNVWLLVAGQRTAETPALEKLAEKLIPGRWRFISWPHERVPDLCGAADVFVLCSLTEAFGLVTIEAMLSELPLVVHKGPVFQDITLGTESALIDMAQEGSLTSALQKYLFEQASGTLLTERASAARTVAVDRFGWSNLAFQYAQMYSAMKDLDRFEVQSNLKL